MQLHLLRARILESISSLYTRSLQYHVANPVKINLNLLSNIETTLFFSSYYNAQGLFVSLFPNQWNTHIIIIIINPQRAWLQ